MMAVEQKDMSAEHKVEQVLRFLKSNQSLSEYCRRYGISESDLRRWKKQFLRGGREFLRYGGVNPEKYYKRIRYLEVKVERLELDNIALKALIRYLKDTGNLA